MRFAVIWLADLEPTLIDLYLRAKQDGAADAVARATAAIDRRLAADPLHDGESPDGQVRILVELPLAVDYELSPDGRTVVVTAVRYLRRP